MVSNLTLIDSLLYENGAIRHHCREIGKLVGDQESLFLQRNDSPLFLVDELARQKLNIGQVMTTLEEALLRHKQLHGELPESLIGRPLSEALEMEHASITEAIKKARLEMPRDLHKLTRAELLADSLQTRSAIEAACILVEAHLTKEDTVLELLKRSLRTKQPATNGETQ